MCNKLHFDFSVNMESLADPFTYTCSCMPTYINACILFSLVITQVFTGGTFESYDYYLGPYYVTIPAGDTNASFIIQIFDDNIVERNETFQLFIDTASLPHYILADGNDSTTVTIVDDNCEFMYVRMYICT